MYTAGSAQTCIRAYSFVKAWDACTVGRTRGEHSVSTNIDGDAALASVPLRTKRHVRSTRHTYGASSYETSIVKEQPQ